MLGYIVYQRTLPVELLPAAPAATEEVLPAGIPAPVQETKAPVPEATPESTPEPTPEPEPEYFLISAIGDCTLTTHQKFSDEAYFSYAGRIKGDYKYPFANTIQYFENDELTIANLECTLSDDWLPANASALFYFRAPKDYAQILIEGSVEFVNTANNHTEDFGSQGKENTQAALREYGIPYGVDKQAQVITTKSGIKTGIYTCYNNYYPDKKDCLEAISQMKADGAEYIIMMFHWGKDEVYYTPHDDQIELAHACIDAGANLVYGSHSHCLQPVEAYNGGYILYSMGNWSFGGSTTPKDSDTAIAQITVKRDADGKISNESINMVPCRVSSQTVDPLEHWNDFKPTPLEEGSEEYERAMSKLTGEYDGPDWNGDYSNWYSAWA